MGRSWIRRVARVLHPIGAGLIKDDEAEARAKQGEQDWQNLGQHNARQAELDAAMKEYEDVPTLIRNKYSEASKKAGTYAATPEFASGMDSEVLAGSRGARVGLAARINALRRAMGNTEEFNPEGYTQTRANETQEHLRNNPEPEGSQAMVSPEAVSVDSNEPAALGNLQASGKPAGSSKTTRSKALAKNLYK